MKGKTAIACVLLGFLLLGMGISMLVNAYTLSIRINTALENVPPGLRPLAEAIPAYQYMINAIKTEAQEAFILLVVGICLIFVGKTLTNDTRKPEGK